MSARWAALRTASSMLSACSVGMPATANGRRICSRSTPMSTAARTRPRAAAASGAKSCPLPLPPAMRITGSAKLSSALIVEATLVPLESL
jgi:hypothetical protein